MARFLPLLIILLTVAFLTKTDFFFYLLYTVFGIFVLGRWWAQRSLRAVVVQRRHDDRVFLGEKFDVQIAMHNPSWLPVLWLRLNDTVPVDLGSSSEARWVVSLLPRERLRLSYTLRGRRRGYYQLGPLLTVGGDLLGTTTYRTRQEKDDFVIVYPKIVPLRDLGIPSQSPFGALPSRQRLFEDPTRIRGVRDYRPGDSPRRMDWKTSARVGALQVRRYEPTMALETAIFLNLDRDDYPQRFRRQATELGIVVAASLATHLVEQRQAVGLFTNGRDPLRDVALAGQAHRMSALPLRKGREHLMRLLDLLARIEVSAPGEAAPFLDLLGRKSLGLPWGCTVVVVTAREVEGLLDTLLALRRRGLLALLVLTCPHRNFALTARQAAQVGVRAFQIWSEGDLDVWR